jgi:glycosyltransferase involved in cell wall biosynthesis
MAQAGRIIERSIVRLPDLIVSVSKLTSGLLVNDLGADSRRVVHVPNGVDLSMFETGPRAKETGTVLYAGRLVPSKRVDLIIKALPTVREAYPDVNLQIIGDGPELPSLKRLADKLGLAGNVLFSGTLPTYQEVADRMMASALFVMPSIREGFGMVVLEAMAASTPVIIVRSKMNAALELVDHGSTGLVVEPENPDAIAEAMVRLLSDHKLYQRLATNGRSLAEKLTWDHTASTIERVYSSFTLSPHGG